MIYLYRGDFMPSEAQKRANLKLQQNRERLSFWVPKDGTKARYMEQAEKQGKSFNQYIVDLIETTQKKRVTVKPLPFYYSVSKYLSICIKYSPDITDVSSFSSFLFPAFLNPLDS